MKQLLWVKSSESWYVCLCRGRALLRKREDSCDLERRWKELVVYYYGDDWSISRGNAYEAVSLQKPCVLLPQSWGSWFAQNIHPASHLVLILQISLKRIWRTSIGTKTHGYSSSAATGVNSCTRSLTTGQECICGDTVPLYLCCFMTPPPPKKKSLCKYHLPIYLLMDLKVEILLRDIKLVSL